MTPNPQSSELQHCHTCNQMTNHGIGTNGGCLKCRVTQSSEVEAIVEEFKEIYGDYLGGYFCCNDDECVCLGAEIDRAAYRWLRTTLTHLTAQHDARMSRMVQDMMNMADSHDFVLAKVSCSHIREIYERYLPKPDTK